MAFRNVIVSNRCKLEYSLNYIICRSSLGDKKIFADEVKLIVINTTQAVLTSPFIVETIRRKIKVIFTDEKHNPIGEIVPYENNYYSYRKIKEQININEDRKKILWQKIIVEKIKNQASNLKLINSKMSEQLIEYSKQVTIGDETNREGHAAKVYFNNLFGDNFNRRDESKINVYLNYGYSILLSSINREIKALGYLTELGIHHIGESNPFNLSCDFIEPYRPYIDKKVMSEGIVDDNYKKEMVSLLTQKVKYKSKEYFFDAALRLWIEDMFNFLINGNENKISFIEYEL